VIAERTGPPVTIGDVVLEPIERVLIRIERLGPAVVGFALKEPVAVVVRSSAGSWRIELDRPGRPHEAQSVG
jgi:hypothetical protein